MAYSRLPGGFKPYGQVLRVGTYRKNGTYVIGQGDMLEYSTSGLARPASVVSSTRNRTMGVAAHFVTSAAGERTVTVYDHPDQLFSVQASVAIENAELYANWILTWTRAGTVSHCNRTLGLSKHILNTSVLNTTGVFRPLGFFPVADGSNTTNTAYNYVYGKINERWHFWTAYNATKGTV